MEKCNDCKKMVEQAPFGQCDDCFEKSMSENGSVVYSVSSEENEKTQHVVSKLQDTTPDSVVKNNA